MADFLLDKSIWDIYWRIGLTIEATVRVRFTRFNAPLTDMELTGTYPAPAVKGNVSESRITAVSGMDNLIFETDLAGTKPHPAIKGAIKAGDIELQTNETGQVFVSMATDSDITGIHPSPTQKGHAEAGGITLGASGEAQTYSTKETGTSPKDAYKGSIKTTEAEIKAKTNPLTYESENAGENPHGAYKGYLKGLNTDIKTETQGTPFKSEESGIHPHEAYIAEDGETFAEIIPKTIAATITYETTGTKPQATKKGSAKDGGTVSPRIELTGMEFHVRPCGTGRPGG